MNKKDVWRIVYASSVKWLPRSCYSNLSKASRAFFAKRILASCGKNVNIERAATFSKEVSLGNNSDIGYKCELHGPIAIGDDVMMGPEVVMYTRNHETSSLEVPMRLQGETVPNPIKIGNDCWIGHRVLILPGVQLGDHTIVAAGAVVTKSFPPYSVIGGVPAKLLQRRNQ